MPNLHAKSGNWQYRFLTPTSASAIVYFLMGLSEDLVISINHLLLKRCAGNPYKRALCAIPPVV
jgi:hypothetical protein